MNPTTIAVTITISTITLYLLFILLGFGGINKNREAQGIKQKYNK
tara:strand:- start:47 stop:181 length:135 start_codon:yes stop_codon:yes gene_type:complete